MLKAIAVAKRVVFICDNHLLVPSVAALRILADAYTTLGFDGSLANISWYDIYGPMAQRSLSDGEYRALAAFRRELRKFLAFSEAEARAAGLEPRQHQLLLAVRGLLPGTSATIGALSAELLLRHHSTVELVDRLERRGFVQRTRSAEDRRKVSVQTTRKGERVLAKLARAHRNELRRVGPSLVAALGAILGPGGRG